MKAEIWKTDLNGNRLTKTESVEMTFRDVDEIEEQGHPGDIEANLINVHPTVEYQTVGGIGGTFTDAAATTWSKMSDDKKEQLIKAFFDTEEGIGFNFGRVSIGSNDFSAGDYTYVKEGDETLDSFDISHDKRAIFPMIKMAGKYSDIKLFASPWSPPAYMKTNNSRIGGCLKKEYYSLWAKHFKKYVETCRENGINIWGVTVQNEPRHHQTWESCLYSKAQEAEFLGYLGKELEGLDVKILCYDHCRERIMDRADVIFSSENGKYCDGIANHWYSGDHFGELRAFSYKYPDKLNVASEGCNAVLSPGVHAETDLDFAEIYAHDICGCFNNGLNYYCDFNLTIDENNGPFHNRENRGRWADAPSFCITASDEIVYRLSYYYIGHFSKFVRRGAKVVGCSSFSDSVEAVSFKNPDGLLVCVLLNRTAKTQSCIVRVNGYIQNVELTPHSIATVLLDNFSDLNA